MPLNAAASTLEPSSQSPQIPARPWGSKIQGTPGVFVGRAAPLKKKGKKYEIRIALLLNFMDDP